jgi:hypothetical protein
MTDFTQKDLFSILLKTQRMTAALYTQFAQAKNIDISDVDNSSEITILEYITMQLRSGQPLSGLNHVMLCQCLGPALRYRDKKSFIQTQAFVSLHVRSVIMKRLPDINKNPTSELVSKIKSRFTEKQTIRCLLMNDPFSPVVTGTVGIIRSIDDAGQLQMNWRNNRTLAINFDAGDMVEVIGSEK